MKTKLEIAIEELSRIKEWAGNTISEIEATPDQNCGNCKHINILRIGMPGCKKKMYYPIKDKDKEFCSRHESKEQSE